MTVYNKNSPRTESTRQAERLGAGRQQRFALDLVPGQDVAPDLLGGFGVPEQVAVLGGDRALVDEEIDIEDAAPELLPDQDNRHRRQFAGLRQGQDLEQLVERAVTAGKRDQRPRPQREMQFAHREIMKTEAQLRRDIRVRVLLLRQRDTEPDRFRADIAGAPVGGLHDAGTAAGHHHDAAADRQIAAMPDQSPERARNIVISALGEDAL